MGCGIISVKFIRRVSIVQIECACGTLHNYRIPKEETRKPCQPQKEK